MPNRYWFTPKTDTIPGILPPAKRIEMIRLKGENGQYSTTELKKELLEQLLEEYVNTPDSIIRQEVVLATAKICALSSGSEQQNPELSKGFDLIKHAALHDDDPFVRREACRVIASRTKPESAIVLRHVVRNDNDKDVQLQAAQSLAKFDDRETVETLGSLLDRRQPALRFTAMESLKSCTKQNYGYDVHRWKQYLAGEIPDQTNVPSLADRLHISAKYR